MKKILDIFIVFVCVIGILSFLGFLFLFGYVIPRLYWPVTLLAGIVFFLYGLVRLVKKKNTYSQNWLLVFNITGTIVLSALYLFTFVLQAGIGWPSVTLGLPLIAGIVFLVIDTIHMIRTKDLLRGLRGFVIGWSAYIFIGLLVFFGASLLVAFPTYGPQETTDREENKVLEMMLKEFYGHRVGYALVKPEISLGWGSGYEKHLESTKGILVDMLSRFITNGHFSLKVDDVIFDTDETTINELIEKFDEVNRFPRTIGVKSSPLEGYYIEYKKSPEHNYVWNLVNPMVGPRVDISLPAYDEDTGLILIYVGETYGPLSGQGGIFLLKYQDGNFITLFYWEIWVS